MKTYRSVIAETLKDPYFCGYEESEDLVTLSIENQDGTKRYVNVPLDEWKKYDWGFGQDDDKPRKTKLSELNR
jgi:hypothetical protein